MSIASVNVETGTSLSFGALAGRLGREGLARLLRSLTVEERPQPGAPPRPVARRTAYRVVQAQIVIPRLIAALLLDKKIITRPSGKGPEEKHHLRLDRPGDASLYEYQKLVVEALCAGALSSEKIDAGCARAYLKMNTGLGKTRTALALVARLQLRALVVVPTKVLRLQWLKEAADVLPELKAVGFSRHAGLAGADLVVAIINTARTMPPEFFSNFGLIVLDEAHELHSRCNYELLWLAQAPAVIGLSATPLERPDRLDRLVPLHLGRPIDAAAVAGDVKVVEFSGRVRVVEYTAAPQYAGPVLTDAGEVCVMSSLKRLLEDPRRLGLVVEEIKQLRAAKHGVLVFSEFREYLTVLHGALERLGLGGVDFPEMSILRGGASAAAVRGAQSAAVVLTTYGYSRRGLSLQHMTSLVLASPRRNGLTQILGRITRRGSDERVVRVVVDIRDMASPLRSQYYTRSRVYLEKGYKVEKIKMKY